MAPTNLTGDFGRPWRSIAKAIALRPVLTAGLMARTAEDRALLLWRTACRLSRTPSARRALVPTTRQPLISAAQHYALSAEECQCSN